MRTGSLALLALLAACGGGGTPPPAAPAAAEDSAAPVQEVTPVDEQARLEAEMEAYADEVCACQDVQCVQLVAKRRAEAVEGQDTSRLAESDRGVAAGLRIAECLKRVMAPGPDE